MSAKSKARAMAQMLYGGPVRDPAIMKAAAVVYAIRERSKRLRSRLKDREEKAVLVLVSALERRGLEACKIGPYLIMADVRMKIRIKKKLERPPDRRRKPGGKG